MGLPQFNCQFLSEQETKYHSDQFLGTLAELIPVPVPQAVYHNCRYEEHDAGFSAVLARAQAELLQEPGGEENKEMDGNKEEEGNKEKEGNKEEEGNKETKGDKEKEGKKEEDNKEKEADEDTAVGESWFLVAGSTLVTPEGGVFTRPFFDGRLPAGYSGPPATSRVKGVVEQVFRPSGGSLDLDLGGMKNFCREAVCDREGLSLGHTSVLEEVLQPGQEVEVELVGDTVVAVFPGTVVVPEPPHVDTVKYASNVKAHKIRVVELHSDATGRQVSVIIVIILMPTIARWGAWPPSSPASWSRAEAPPRAWLGKVPPLRRQTSTSSVCG